MLALQVYDQPGGKLLADWSSRAKSCVFTTGEHGYKSLQATIRMPRAEAWRWYDRGGLPHVELNKNGTQVWEGRLEDPALVAGGLQIGAFGYWNSLSDSPYTALWSDKKLDRWRAMDLNEIAFAQPDRFTFTKQDALRISPQKNSTQGLGTIGYMAYEPPHGGSRPITQVTFDYAFLAPAAAGVTWRAELRFCDAAFTSLSLGWQLIANGTGVAQTGTVTATYAGSATLILRLLNSAAAAVYAGETDAVYVKLTNLRVMTATVADIDDIANDLVATVSALNPTQLSTNTAFVNSPGLDLTNEIYEDQYPADILTRLAKLGDAATPPNQWETGVYRNRRLYLRIRGSAGRAWYVTAAALTLEPSLDNLRNSTYATYQSPTNRTLRGGTADNLSSQTRYGIVRRATVGVQTTDVAIANTQRDAYLSDHATIIPRSSIALGQAFVQDNMGGIWPAWMVRAGDTVTVRSLPVTLGAGVDRIRTMRIAGTSYDCFSRKLTLTPESPLPGLEQMVARRGEGL